ncbi:MAG: hypothetical protein PUP91_22440 [Rhizonema sp. PD37]|nr:hypothetical protein [Rhizonema sp. PD37]
MVKEFIKSILTAFLLIIMGLVCIIKINTSIDKESIQEADFQNCEFSDFDAASSQIKQYKFFNKHKNICTRSESCSSDATRKRCARLSGTR